MACGNVDIVQSADWIVKGGDVVKWYLVTVNLDGTITNKLIRANSPEEARRRRLNAHHERLWTYQFKTRA
jgi:hypothetical protein